MNDQNWNHVIIKLCLMLYFIINIIFFQFAGTLGGGNTAAATVVNSAGNSGSNDGVLGGVVNSFDEMWDPSDSGGSDSGIECK